MHASKFACFWLSTIHENYPPATDYGRYRSFFSFSFSHTHDYFPSTSFFLASSPLELVHASGSAAYPKGGVRKKWLTTCSVYGMKGLTSKVSLSVRERFEWRGSWMICRVPLKVSPESTTAQLNGFDFLTTYIS